MSNIPNLNLGSSWPEQDPNTFYTSILLISLLQTLRENGTVSEEQFRGIFQRGAKMVESLLAMPDLPPDMKSKFSSAYEMLLQGAN